MAQPQNRPLHPNHPAHPAFPAFAQGQRRRQGANAGLVGPIPAVSGFGPYANVGASSGLDLGAWASENKWYLIGGGLILAAGATWFLTK